LCYTKFRLDNVERCGAINHGRTAVKLQLIWPDTWVLIQWPSGFKGFQPPIPPLFVSLNHSYGRTHNTLINPSFESWTRSWSFSYLQIVLNFLACLRIHRSTSSQLGSLGILRTIILLESFLPTMFKMRGWHFLVLPLFLLFARAALEDIANCDPSKHQISQFTPARQPKARSYFYAS
jgi:hypothetical protein